MNIRQIKEIKNTPRLLLTKFVVGDEHGVPVRHNLQWVIVEDRHLPVSIHKPLNLREDCDYVSRAPFIVDYMFDVPKTKQNKTVQWLNLPDVKWHFYRLRRETQDFHCSPIMFITKMASAVSYSSFKKQYLVKIWIYYVYLNKILIAKVFEIFSSVSETYSRSKEKLLDTQNPVVCIPETSIN